MGSKCSKTKPIPPMPSQLHSESSPLTSFKSHPLEHSQMELLHIEELLGRDPDDPQLNLRMAMALYRRGQTEDSQQYFEAVCRTEFPLCLESLLVVSGLFLSRGEYKSSLGHLEAALCTHPTCPELHHQLSEAYRGLSNNEKAMKHLKLSVKHSPGNWEYLNEFGLHCFHRNLLPKAQDCFTRALQLHNDYPQAHNNLGNTYRKQGDSQAALEHYKLAVAKTYKRKFPTALLNLATTFFDLGEVPSALNCFQEALSAGSNIHKLMVAKGYHLLFKSPKTKPGIEALFEGDLHCASTLLTEALQNDPLNPAVNYYLAVTYARLGDSFRTQEYLGAVKAHCGRPIHSGKRFVLYFLKKANGFD